MTLHNGQKAIGRTARSPDATSRSRSASERKLALAAPTATATAAAGTVASRTGTRRPARPTIQRGKRSPHGRSKPIVSTVPTSANPPRPVAARAMSGSSRVAGSTPSGMPAAQASRVTP
ncbi:hypothetical protein GCM10009687_10280 [Asanoa iriomotensis]